MMEILEPENDLLGELVRFYNDGSWEKVVNNATNLLRQYPLSINLLNVLGAAHSKLGDPRLAISKFKKGLLFQPSIPELYNSLALSQQELGELSEALRINKYGLILQPNSLQLVFNRGNLLRDNKMPFDAVKAYQSAIGIDSDVTEAHTNLGIIFLTLMRFSDANESFGKAINIQIKRLIARQANSASNVPLNGHLFYNKALALEKLMSRRSALKFYQKSILVQPCLAEGYEALNRIFYGFNDFYSAMTFSTKALRIKPDNADFLCNMGRNAIEYYDGDQALEFFKKSLVIDPTNKYSLANLLACNPHRLKETDIEWRRKKLQCVDWESVPELSPVSVTCLLPIGRAASIFLHSLVDGHPEVSTIPGVYFQGWFGQEAWEYFKPNYDDKNWRGELTEKIVSHYEPLFDANSKKDVFGSPFGNTDWLANYSGFMNMGDKGNEAFKIDKGSFRAVFGKAIENTEIVSKKSVFELINWSLTASTLGIKSSTEVEGRDIFYHIHKPSIGEITSFLNYYPTSKFLYIVRNPLQGMESWMLTHKGVLDDLQQGKYKRGYGEYQGQSLAIDPLLEAWSKVISPIQMMFYVLFIPSTIGNESRGIRLEDLKRKPKQTVEKISRWLGISNHEALMQSSFCGYKYWGPASNSSGLITGFDPKPLEFEIGRILGERDIEIFETLFWPISRDFGYLKDRKLFLKDELKKIKPWLDEPFEFEKRLFEGSLPEAFNLEDMGPFQRLHKLVELCWEVLFENGHYPNRISPLD